MIDYTNRTRNICIYYRVDSDSDRFFEYTHMERCVGRETAEYLAENRYKNLDGAGREKYRELIRPFVENIAMIGSEDDHIVVTRVAICDRYKTDARYSFEGDAAVFAIEEGYEDTNDRGRFGREAE